VRAGLVYSLGYLFAPLKALLPSQTTITTLDDSTASKLAQLRSELQQPLADYQIYLELLKSSLDSTLLNHGEQPESKLVQLVAAISLTRLLGDQAPTQAIDLLVATLTSDDTARDELAQQYKRLPWVDDDIAGDIAGSLCQLQPELAAQVAIPALRNALQSAKILTALTITAALLYMTFNPQGETGVASEEQSSLQGRQVEPLTWETLNLSQKQVLESLATSPNVWSFKGNRLPNLLKEYRLPTSLADLQLFMQAVS
jgi:hypothetical protein